VRVDPTAAISPTRVESGLEEALAGEGSFLADSPLSPLRFRDVDWVNRLRLRLDAINYSWQLFVLQYDDEKQQSLVEDYLGGVSKTTLVSAMVLAWCLLLIPVMVTLVWRRRGPRPEPATRAYLDFCEKLRRSGLQRQPQEAPGVFARRVAIERPEVANEVEAITKAYEALAYRGVAKDIGLRNLQQKVRDFHVPGQARQFRPAWLGPAG
jgi:hypothetical protein